MTDPFENPYASPTTYSHSVISRAHHIQRWSNDRHFRSVNARPIWARHYEIGTNRPIFAGRDGIKKYSLAEIDRDRRTGSVWSPLQ